MEMKYKFDIVDIEITRKCQIKCKHCCRGDAQNVDMSEEIMEKFISQCDSINYLTFTGGEPFCNIEGLHSFLDIMKKNSVKLKQLSIITNGFNHTQEIIDLINDFYNYISDCYDSSFYQKKRMVYLSVSNDPFHSDCNYNPLEAYGFYEKAFADNPMIHIDIDEIGVLPYNQGRGKYLKETRDYFQKVPTKIEYISPDRKMTACQYGKYYRQSTDNQIYIFCPMYLSAKGDLIKMNSMQPEYIEMDKSGNTSKICNIMKDDIMQSVIRFNQDNKKMYCLPHALGVGSVLEAHMKKEREKFGKRLLVKMPDVHTSNEELKTDAIELLNRWIEFRKINNVDALGNSTK